jgi:polyhydroxybutyrate depolymerase
MRNQKKAAEVGLGMLRSLASILLILVPLAAAAGQDPQGSRRGKARDPDAGRAETLTLAVDGQVRTALLYRPEVNPESSTGDGGSRTGAPVVFAFHGHHGHSLQTARKFQIQRVWPSAIVVYPQGLPTVGITDPQGKAPGWQRLPGEYDDRDLKFFDALLARIAADQAVDPQRVFAMGHSNGGMITYLLWAVRGDKLAAVAPVAANCTRLREHLTPKPAMHFAGRKDPLVPFALQQRSIDVVKKLNGCGDTFEAWSERCRCYESEQGTPFVEYIHAGGHEYPDDASELIVKFFRQQTRQ